jgi:hypothetical protein
MFSVDLHFLVRHESAGAVRPHERRFTEPDGRDANSWAYLTFSSAFFIEMTVVSSRRRFFWTIL